VDEQAVAAWLDGYSRAWKTYDPEQIGELFSEDAVYFDNPFDEPVRGREAIVASWLEDPDEEGTYEGRYRPVLVAGDQAVANGYSRYLDGIYMDAVQAMTGQGGWPMTVFQTPEARPGIEGEIVERARAFVDRWTPGGE